MKPTNVPSLVLCVVAVLALTGPAQADPPYWHRTVVDAGVPGVGEWCSLAFDPNGDPAIAYLDANSLMLARFDSNDPNHPDGVWHKSVVVVDPNIPENDLHGLGGLSLAFQSNGYPAIAHPMGQLTFGGCEWYFRWQDAAGWHYKRLNQELLEPIGWGLLAATSMERVRLCFAQGRAWVVFDVFALLLTATLCAAPDVPGDPGGLWSLGVVTMEAGWGINGPYASLAIDGNGWPSCSYIHLSDDEDEQWVSYAWHEPWVPLDPCSDWPFEEVADPCKWGPGYWGTPTSLAFDANGVPGIAFFPTHMDPLSRIWYAWKDPGEWWDYGVAYSIPTGMLPTEREAILAYRFDSNPGISFRAWVEDGGDAIWPLLYMWLDPNDPNDPVDPKFPCDGVWQVREVDARKVFGHADKGEYHSHAIDPNGLPAIAYYDTTFDCLRYAVTADQPDTYTLTTWNEGQGHGTWGSIEIDPNLERYPEGTVVTLTGIPSDGKRFAAWVIYDPRYPGDANYARQDSNNPLHLLIEYDREVGAAFACASGNPLLGAMVGGVCATLITVKVSRTRRRRSRNEASRR